MNALSNALLVITSLFSLLAILCAAAAVVRVRQLQDRLTPLPLSRLDSLETLLPEVMQAIEDVANRVKMQRVRTITTHAERSKADLPDPYKDPDGWRLAMNKKLAAGKVGGPKS